MNAKIEEVDYQQCENQTLYFIILVEIPVITLDFLINYQIK